MQEICKAIKDYENYYEVSNFGNVRSLDRIAKTKAGVIKPTKGKVLSLTLKNNGYKTVMLCVNDKRKRFHVHRLVAQAFIHNPENKSEVNHKDGNKENNNVANLEWNTLQENREHASRNNLIRKGESSYQAKLSENNVLAIRRLFRINPNFNKCQIAKKLNVRDTTIHKIIKNKRWKHLIT